MGIRVAIAGPRGRMGSEAVRTVMEESGMELVAALDYKEIGTNLNELEMFPENYEIPIYTDLKMLIEDTAPDVFLDLTTPQSVYEHTITALKRGVRVVIGTTGFTAEQLHDVEQLAKTQGTGALIVPNFAIGAILLMKFSKMAAEYLPDVEIIELHHDRKLDAPSGTAVKTAQLITEVRESHKQGHPDEHETMAGARGANFDGIPIHSVRLPGLVAHQTVLFGGEGQLLTLKHDSFDRKSFMSGVTLSIRKVMEMNHLIYGLEELL